MSDERRERRRIKAAVEVSVSDASSGQLFGRVANLSVDGLMMLSSKLFEVGQRYSVLLEAKAPEGAASMLPEMPIKATLECIWVEPLAGSTWVGGRFINASSQDVMVVAQLVAAFEAAPT